MWYGWGGSSPRCYKVGVGNSVIALSETVPPWFSDSDPPQIGRHRPSLPVVRVLRVQKRLLVHSLNRWMRNRASGGMGGR